MIRTVLSILAMVVVASCGPKAVFQLSADENNRSALGHTLARRQLPARATPINAAGQPQLFAVIAEQPRDTRATIVAFDLATGNARWKADANVKSRIVVGGDFIATREDDALVARDQARGAVRWRVDVPGTLVGHAADCERVYAVFQRGTTYSLAAFAGADGERLWTADAAGRLGAPAAHGGLVLVPFLSQWLSIVDGARGTQLTRIRGIDEQISMLRVTSQVAYFGSKQGVFQLDVRSASGKRTEATYGRVIVPPQLERTQYGPDAYDAVQAGYSAFDRARILWTGSPAALSRDPYAVHYFRFVFGFAPDGAIRWAYSHPRVELVASEHTGNAIVAVSSSGEVVALDPASGAVRGKHDLGVPGTVVGATIDADGWAPAATGPTPDPLAALVGIVRDPDARFERVKELAVIALAKRPEPAVTSELLAILADPRLSPRLEGIVVELLVQRRDPQGLPALVGQLGVHADHLAQTTPARLGAIAKAIAGLAGTPIEDAHRAAAVAALVAHLEAPTTPVVDLVHVIAALAAIGDGRERGALGWHLVMYHADDELGGDVAWQKAIVGALARGGPPERAVLQQVAADPRTRPGLVAAIRDLGAGS